MARWWLHSSLEAFFRMMQAVERAGIPSRFPHDSGLYELLASKRWTYYMALDTWPWTQGLGQCWVWNLCISLLVLGEDLIVEWDGQLRRRSEEVIFSLLI